MNISGISSSQVYVPPQTTQLKAPSPSTEAQESRAAEKVEPKQVQRGEPGESGSTFSVFA
jgi:hypothetical protein